MIDEHERKRAQTRLDEMVGDLERFRSRRREAQSTGDSVWAERCYGSIRLLHRLIRQHCVAFELERPHDVPEAD